MSTRFQQGFAHAVLIIGLAIALVGALGFVFWQNFIYKEPVATKTEIVSASPKEDEESVTPSNQQPNVVNEDDYSFTVVEGFSESSKQMFKYTASLKAVKTFVNKEGDYFEVLVPQGEGGGMSADYFWDYTVSNSKLSLKKSDRCKEGDFACTANNSSVEGIISNQGDKRKYYLAFGNKAKNEIKLAFVDDFVSTFQFK